MTSFILDHFHTKLMTSFSCKVQNPSLSHFWPFYSKLIIFTNMQSLLKTHTKYSRKPMSIFWEALRAGKYMDRPKFKWRCRKAEVSLTKLYFELFYWHVQIISPRPGAPVVGMAVLGMHGYTQLRVAPSEVSFVGDYLHVKNLRYWLIPSTVMGKMHGTS